MIFTSAQVLGQSDSHITWMSERIGIHKNMVTAWLSMQTEAKSAGLNLQIASGFRNFERQLMIFNNKLSGKAIVKDSQNIPVDMSKLTTEKQVNAIMHFSALPGASRHHWGTDIDVYDPDLLGDNKLMLEPWEYSEKGPFAKLSLWLKAHAHEFGFFFPYASYQGGVAAEPWHLSYLPLAKEAEQALSLDVLASAVAKSNLQNKGEICAMLPALFEQYVTNVCGA